MRISRILASVSIVFLLLLLGEGVFPNPRPLENKKIVFEEVGQFNDGGMAVTVLVVNDRAYVCEFDKGLEILDISNPAHIVKLGQIEVTEQARGIEIIGNIAYVSCNTNGLKLFDISDPSKPVYLGQYGDRDGDPHQFLAAGDIGYLTEWHGGFDIIDISDPLKPVRLSQYKDDGLAFSVDIVGSYAFVTEYRAGLKILDISDSKNPVLIGDFNNGGETNALRVVDGRAYVCDKLQGLEILDVSDPAHPHLLGTFNGGGSTVGVRLVDDWAFVINWELGLEAIDVSDPARPVRIGSFYDGGRPNGFQVVGDLIYMADGSDGLEIVRYTQQKDFSVLTGPYLGQKPPGMTAEIFAPGIVSTEHGEFCSVFSHDGSEFYWSIVGAPYPVIAAMRQNNGQWTEPEIVPFSGKYLDNDMSFTPDGKRLFFCSRRPLDGSGPPTDHSDFWFVERHGASWSKPRLLEGPVNSNAQEYYPIFAQNGTLYFCSTRPGGYGGGDIYRARFKNGEYLEPENLGPPINTENFEGDLYIAADESYIIVTCYGRSDGIGSGDLYISFRREDGSWSSLKNMGVSVNSAANEHCPILSPDGKYLFFSSGRSRHSNYSKEAITFNEKVEMMNSWGNGRNEDIYWVDARIIETLRPKDLNPNSPY